MNKILSIIFGLALLSTVNLMAQNDSIMFNNGDEMVGELKSMDNSIVVFKTEYSDVDFKVEWSGISKLHSETEFLISHTDGRIFIGSLSSVSKDSIQILEEDNNETICHIENLVYLRQVKRSFLDRLYASVDIGLSLTKANDLQQFSSRTTLGYVADNWSTNLKFNTIISTQNNAETIRRIEGAINERYIFKRNWYTIFELSSLSNTEQALDLRLNTQLALGHFLVRNNSLFWGVKGGFNRNMEKYSTETEKLLSWEGYLGIEANFFNTGDFSFYAIIKAYPSITTKGRWRSDMSLDLKYDLPLDFYIKIGGTLNFDNMPVDDTSRTDYVLQTGFGWEW